LSINLRKEVKDTHTLNQKQSDISEEQKMEIFIDKEIK
jgi:hypothetical protein